MVDDNWIFESPDDGKTVFRRVFGSNDREVLVDGVWVKHKPWEK